MTKSFVFLVLILALGQYPLSASELPKPQLGTNMADCVAKLKQQGGGWCEIRVSDKHPSISSVWPRNLDKKTRMVSGPQSILRAWNGAAYDDENHILYFLGGGHTDYGGNEVYEFNLNSGKWARLTAPSPLNSLYRVKAKAFSKPAVYCWVPDLRVVPGSAHTYDGLQFSRQFKTIFYAVGSVANGSCFRDKAGKYDDAPQVKFFDRGTTTAIYEFNPSRTATRHGLKPLTWRRLERSHGFRFPRFVELPDGSMMVGDRASMYRLDPVTGLTRIPLWSEADYGDGLAEYHPSGLILMLSSGTLRIRDLATGWTRKVLAPQMHGKSMAISKDRIVFSWNGSGRILTLDPRKETPTWTLYDWGAAGPRTGNSRVYSKWQYVSEEDVFVGLSSHKTGVWVYKHPSNMRGTEISTLDLQKIIRQAPAGATVTLPPGTYGRGLYIDKSLTVKLSGVKLWGISRSRSIINVNCNDCNVIIEDFEADGPKAGCLFGNCAGIKVEGIGFNLTVRRAHIDNTVMGILTDNRGGTLTVEDSLIENTGLNDRSATLGHGLYAGRIEELVVRNTTIRNVNSDGHILKSRAIRTTLEQVRLLGEKGFHSRTIDLPCGSDLKVNDSILQHGENTDNVDVISVGTEPKYCKNIKPSHVSITNSVIIIDRNRSADERAREYGPNYLFNWRAPFGSIHLSGNRIVNLEHWSTAWNKRNIHIPDQSTGNKICSTRAACGL